jgi:hypothetical protein
VDESARTMVIQEWADPFSDAFNVKLLSLLYAVQGAIARPKNVQLLFIRVGLKKDCKGRSATLGLFYNVFQKCGNQSRFFGFWTDFKPNSG